MSGALGELGELGGRVVVTSFDLRALRQVRAEAPGVPTACFVPTGHGVGAIARLALGGALAEVDRCLNQGHDYVFVPPSALEGRVVAHARHAQTGLGVFGADTADGHDAVMRWSYGIEVVYADRPAMYGAR